jgi:hypothetical protein
MMGVCVLCDARITFQFSLCAECEDIWGRRVKDWPEWLRFMVNDSRRLRRSFFRDKSRLVKLDSNANGFSMMNMEELIIAKESIACYFTSDGDEMALMDSDWEAVYDWSY